MDNQKTLNSLNEARDSKFVTWKWNIVNNQWNANYNNGNGNIYNIEALKCNLWAYIPVRGNINIIEDNGLQVTFKNCVLFIKIDGTIIDDAEDLDFVM